MSVGNVRRPFALSVSLGSVPGNEPLSRGASFSATTTTPSRKVYRCNEPCEVGDSSLERPKHHGREEPYIGLLFSLAHLFVVVSLKGRYHTQSIHSDNNLLTTLGVKDERDYSDCLLSV